MTNKQEIKWLNCAKFMAIFAVIVDHTNSVLYTNQDVSMASYYSVSLFIIISGLMCYMSNERHHFNWWQTFLRSSKKIIIAYLLATFIYLVYITRSFDFNIYLQYVIHFNISGPFYFVLLYIQLMLINRLMYDILKNMTGKYMVLLEIGGGAVVLYISSLTTNFTNILDAYGGGGKLFGGTYLFLFYLGMLFAKHDLFKIITAKVSCVVAISSVVLWFAWWRFLCYNRFAIDARLPFGGGFNPPSISESILALIMLALSYGLFSFFSYIKYLRIITDIISWMGRHTLYIFLYHRFFLDWILLRYFPIDNIWERRFIYLGTMFLCPILIEIILKKAKTIVCIENKQRDD